MTEQSFKKSQVMVFAALGMIFMAAFSRLIPHAPNFTAVTAMALFAAAQLQNRWLAVLVPVLALLLTDVIIGFHEQMWFTYIPFIVITLVASFALKSEKSQSWIKVGSASLIASLFFFAVSNFGVWLISGMYTRTAQGLATCYVMALPFLQNQVFGDLFFSALLFGAYALVRLSVADSSRAL